VTVALAFACAPPGADPSAVAPPDEPPDDDPADTPIADTPAADTPAEPDAPSGDTDPAEEPAPPPEPPVSWGPGFRRIDAGFSSFDGVIHVGERGVQGPSQVRASWTDLDEDGALEALVTVDGADLVGRAIRVFEFDPASGDVVLAPDLLARLPATYGYFIAGAQDLDGDGRVDLLAASTDLPVLLQAEDGRFVPSEDVRQRRITERVEGAWSTADLDADGLPDLVGGYVDCDRTVGVWEGVGGGRFEARRDLTPTYGGPLARIDAILAWPREDGAWVHVLHGGLCSPPDAFPSWLESVLPGADGFPRWTVTDLAPTNGSWRWSPLVAGRSMSLLTPMGLAMADLDEDGCADQVHSLSWRDLALFQGDCAGGLTDRTDDARMALPATSPMTQELPWGVALEDFDLDGRVDVFVATGDDMTSFFAQDGWVHHPHLWWNAGGMAFREVSGAVGMDLAGGNWHAIDIADLDEDGDPDLLVGATGQLPMVLRNEIDTGNHGLSLRLRGTTSHPSGMGAQVEVEVAGLPLQRRAVGAIANVQTLQRPWVFVGLGDATIADVVRIRWPSGTVQELRGLEAGRLHEVVEPAVIEVSPASRRAPADGASVVSLRVVPRALDGSPRAATVSASLDGPGTLAGIAPDGDGYRVDITAPDHAGVTRVTVLLDGQPVGVRPRIWWDAP
jgi:hypothetical protein